MIRAAIGAGFLWAGLSGCALAAGATNRVPAVRIDPPVFDLGTVFRHEVIELPFLVWNEEPGPVRIAGIGSNCDGCMTYALDREVIPAGEPAVLDVLLTPEGLAGPVRILVPVRLDGAWTSHPGIQITADVVPSYHVAGGPVVFDGIPPGETRTWRLRVRPNHPVPGRLTRLESERQEFSGTVELDEADGSYVVSIVAGPFDGEGLVASALRLTSDAPGMPDCVIPVFAYLDPPVHVFPDRLEFRATDEQQFRTIFLRQSRNPPVRVTGVDVPSNKIACQIRQDYPLPEYRINVYAVGLKQTVGTMGDILVHTDEDQGGPIRVPVVVRDLSGVSVESPCLRRHRLTRHIPRWAER